MKHLALAALLLAAQDRPRLVPGVSITFETAAGADVRHARLAALYVPAGTPSTPFLAPGPFRATFEGFVSVDIGTECFFTAEGRGTLTLTVAGKPALEAAGDDFARGEGKPVMLRKGRNRLVARYAGPAAGDAWVRLFWSSVDFAREPVPPTALSHDADLPALERGRAMRQGRELLASRRCLKCHAHEAKGMPELEMDAPSLAEAGARLRPDWTAAWILEPRSLRPEATMPRLPGITVQDAADIAAYLGTLGKPADPPKAAADGGRLFADLRCVACHTLPEREPAADRIPLRHVRAKWSPGALAAFLRAPEKHYAWIEMPNFNLTEDEASRLAAFLLSRPQQDVKPAPAGDAGRGRTRFESAGCMNCHAAPGTNAFKAAPCASLPKDGRACKAADSGLSAAERAAIAAVDLESLSREAAPEFAERQVKALRCAACHKRDGEADLWHELAKEAEALAPPKEQDPEVLNVPIEPVVPSLTWAGEKLKPDWMGAFLSGRVPYRPRPWLPVRMPAFPARADLLARGLALSHGCPPIQAPEPAPDPALAGIGIRLAGKNGGLACTSCHDVGRVAAVGVFEAPGPNLMHTRERLRRDYYLRWMLAPLRVEPGTKMPQFSNEGRSQLTEFLDGDAARQFEALWHYLLAGEKIRAPRD